MGKTLKSPDKIDNAKPKGLFPSRSVTHCLLIIIVGITVYANTFAVPFILDDVTSIIGNPLVRDFHWTFKPRIIGDLTFAMNYYMHGNAVAGYHAVNLMVHLLNGILVYALFRLLLKAPFFAEASPEMSHIGWIPFLIALFFICHPVQTQAVTYISQRVASLATLFYLGTHVAWLSARLSTFRKNQIFFGCVVVTSAILVMATKEIAFTLPLTIILVELVFFGRPQRQRLIVLLLFSLTALVVPLTLLTQLGGSEGSVARLWRLVTPTTAISRADYFLTQIRVEVTYLRLLFFPTGQNLDYDYLVYQTFYTPPVVASFILIVAILIGAIYLLFRSRQDNWPLLRLASFGILWFFITQLVESSVIPLQDVIFEHRLYLPSIGFFVAVVSVLMVFRSHLILRSPKVAKCIIPALCVAACLLAGTAAARNAIWKNEVTLWEDVASKSPLKARVHGSLGLAYQKSGRFDHAAREYETAIKLAPQDPAGYINLGAMYHRQNKWSDAADSYRKALQLNPANVKAHYNLGLVLADEGKLNEAERELREALRLNPAYDQAHNNLGIVYAKQMRNTEALEEFRKAVDLNSANNEAKRNVQSLEEEIKKELSKPPGQP